MEQKQYIIIYTLKNHKLENLKLSRTIILFALYVNQTEQNVQSDKIVVLNNVNKKYFKLFKIINVIRQKKSPISNFIILMK